MIGTGTYVGLIGKVEGDLFIRRLQVLAVAAPGSRECDNDVFCRILCSMSMMLDTQTQLLILTRATSSNVCVSNTLNAGAGGGLIFDLTPELSVTLADVITFAH